MDKIAQKFNQIYRDIGVPFIHPSDLHNIIKNISNHKCVVKQNANDDTKRTSWDIDIVIGLLKKGVNPAAIETIITSVDLLVYDALRFFMKKDLLLVLELGCGAGWSTVVLYNKLKELYGNNFVLVTCDSSVYAVATTDLLLSYYKISHLLINDKCPQINSNIGGHVLLCCNDFGDIVDCMKNNSLNAVFSNHGLDYIDIDKFKNVLKKIEYKLKENGSFVCDSLHPELILDLDRKIIQKGVFWGNNVKKLNRNVTSAGAIIQNNYIVKLGGFSSARFMDFMHYLFWRHNKLFKEYIAALNSSVEAQKLLREWVKIPVSDFYALDRHKLLNSKLKTVPIPEKYKEKIRLEHPYTETVWFIKK